MKFGGVGGRGCARAAADFGRRTLSPATHPPHHALPTHPPCHTASPSGAAAHETDDDAAGVAPLGAMGNAPAGSRLGAPPMKTKDNQ